MIKAFRILNSVIAILFIANFSFAQEVQVIKPVTEMRSALAINYPEGPSALSVKFSATERLPKATAEARVKRKKGKTEIEIEVDEMKPATFFGGDFATYVLWVVSPEGHVDNIGELILEGNHCKLNATTPLETFGMFVTAEPHFLVDFPSRFVVLENTRPKNNLTGQMLETANIKYRGFDGIYHASQESLLEEPKVKGEVRSDVRQARVSLSLAERAGAREFAAEEFNRARESWQKVAEAAEANVDKKILMTMGHETVRLATDAEKKAKERSFQTALDTERKNRAEEISDLKGSIDKAQSETERAQLEAKQKALELAIEQAARSSAQMRADELARKAAEAEAKAAAAQQQANSQAADAEKARSERDAARARMREALSAVVETRETARGLIVNLPDILFDFNKSTLKPDAREKLSKVCGILLVASGYNLNIEGHTDSVGSDEYNQKLSEQRAQSVSNYLNTCGIEPAKLSSEGFGKTKPIAPNDTEKGRQQNRRVEIVISDSSNADARVDRQ